MLRYKLNLGVDNLVDTMILNSGDLIYVHYYLFMISKLLRDKFDQKVCKPQWS